MELLRLSPLGRAGLRRTTPRVSTPAKRWYDNDVHKQDANLFVKADWQVARGLHLFADMQYRYVSYEAWGVNDNYVDNQVNPDGTTGGMQLIDVDKQYHFFQSEGGPDLRVRAQPHALRPRSPSHRRSPRATTSPTASARLSPAPSGSSTTRSDTRSTTAG